MLLWAGAGEGKKRELDLTSLGIDRGVHGWAGESGKGVETA